MAHDRYGMDREVYEALVAEGWTPPPETRAGVPVDAEAAAQPPKP